MEDVRSDKVAPRTATVMLGTVAKPISVQRSHRRVLLRRYQLSRRQFSRPSTLASPKHPSLQPGTPLSTPQKRPQRNLRPCRPPCALCSLRRCSKPPVHLQHRRRFLHQFLPPPRRIHRHPLQPASLARTVCKMEMKQTSTAGVHVRGVTSTNNAARAAIVPLRRTAKKTYVPL